MKFKIYFFVLFSFLIQLSYSQKSVDVKYEAAKEAYYLENYDDAYLLIKEAKKSYKSIPPKVAYLEILINDKVIKNNPYNDFLILDETRKLVKIYKNKYVKFQNDNYKDVLQIGYNLNQYPDDISSFNAIKDEKLQEIELEKERIEKQALEAKQKAEADRIKKNEEDRIKKIIANRKERLRPYINPEVFTEYELANFSETEFNEKLNKVIQESIKIKADEKKIKDTKEARLAKLDSYRMYVSYENLQNLGTYSENKFDEIYQSAKSEYKKAEKINKSRLRSFSSLGFQSGEIAKYGFTYELGGKKAIGFRLSARTSLTDKNDIYSGKVTKNKSLAELGPIIKISNRLYLNLPFGYGIYERLSNNDYSGQLLLTKTGFTVFSPGIIIRLGNVVNINAGASFMDIEKHIYKPEITFGISFNLKSKYNR